jgi:hypothetical protein
MARSAPVASHGAAIAQRRLPPIAVLCPLSIGLVASGGIYLAAHLPRVAPLGPAIALLALAAAALLAAVILVSRVRDFAWATFRQVVGWAAVAYLIVGGMLEYVFVLDHTRGMMLVLLTLMLAVFTANIPLLFGFSVARYQPPDRK